MALVSGISLDPEAAIGVTKRLPPKWVDGADEVSCAADPAQFDLSFRYLLVLLVTSECSKYYGRNSLRRNSKMCGFLN